MDILNRYGDGAGNYKTVTQTDAEMQLYIRCIRDTTLPHGGRLGFNTPIDYAPDECRDILDICESSTSEDDIRAAGYRASRVSEVIRKARALEGKAGGPQCTVLDMMSALCRGEGSFIPNACAQMALEARRDYEWIMGLGVHGVNGEVPSPELIAHNGRNVAAKNVALAQIETFKCPAP